MSLEGILNISGKSGLFRVLKTTPRSFIVESMDEHKKRFSVSAANRIAALSEISIYTLDDQMMLQEVFRRMRDHIATGAEMPDPKTDEKSLRDFFYKIVPDQDEEKVYASDVRKVLKWYSLLKSEIDFDEEDSDEETSDEEE